MPHLLAALAEASYTNAAGETLSGNLLTDATAIVYCDRDDLDAARGLSQAADVRIAWGGREAVEAIMNLPRRYGTEDIIFGPKLSCAVVAKERLADTEIARRAATAIAADAAAFEQQGCTAAHGLRGNAGGRSPVEFARLTAGDSCADARRLPRSTQPRP